jgi:hypothetical protein
MAKLIKTLHDRVQKAIKKGLTGYVSPDRLVEEAYAEIMNLWLELIPKYASDQKVVLFFKQFEKIEAVSGLSGGSTEGTKAVTECHKYPISIVTSGGIVVDKLTIGEYSNRFNHPNKPPTASYPICKFVGNVIYVAPKLDVSVSFIAVPVKPVYAYTVSGDDYIYDDSASTDIDIDKLYVDMVVNRALANLGIEMRDGDVLRYSQQEKITEGK